MGESKKRVLTDSRVTIMISPLLEKEIRNRQAKHIVENQESYSFSKALCDVLRIGLGKVTQ